MRQEVDKQRVIEFVEALAKVTDEDTNLYLTGGATAVVYGWRSSTIDIDIRLAPESDRILREIEPLKNKLGINVESASPADFIPVKDGWEERSPFVVRTGRITVRHFDLYAQALSKLERGHPRDLNDVRAMVERQLVQPDRLLNYFNDIAPVLFRFPAIDAEDFRTRVEEFVRASCENHREVP